jgi:hypothetical protein
MSRSYTSSPPCAPMACSGTALLFTSFHIDLLLVEQNKTGFRRIFGKIEERIIKIYGDK